MDAEMYHGGTKKLYEKIMEQSKDNKGLDLIQNCSHEAQQRE